MQLFVLLWLATIACGARRACDVCRIIRQDIPLPPVKHCKCIEKYFEWVKSQRPKETDAAIYYEPVETMFLQDILPVYTNPFINNAGITVHDKQIHESIIPNLVYPTNQFEDHNIPSTSPKIKRKYSLLNNKKDYEPLYMDINIHSKSDHEEIQVKDLFEKKIKELSEKKFKDCLDLYAIIHYRNIGVQIQEDNIISKRNKIYNELSDAELDVELNNKCEYLASVITESVNDVKKTRPYLRELDNLVSQYPRYKNATEELIISENKFQKSHATEKHIKQFVTSTAKPNIEENALSFANIIPARNDIVPESDSFQKADIDESKLSILFNTGTTEHGLNNIISTTPESEIIPSTLSSNAKKNKTIDIIYTKNTGTKVLSNLDNRIGTDCTREILSVTESLPEDHNIESTSEFSKQVYDDIYSVFQQQSAEATNQESEYFNNLKDDLMKFKIGKVTKSKEYFEGEYEIPKIITVEFPNDTIVSEIQGNETIPNLDFVSSEVAVEEGKSFGTFTTSSEPNTSSYLGNSAEEDNVVVSTGNSNNVINTADVIRGKLYFKYGLEYVPASFSQQPDGRIDVALDILSLCTSNNKEDTSLLIKAMCKCIEMR